MRAFLILVLLFTFCLPAAAQVTIATESYYPSRTDANTSETLLTPTNVANGAFQKLYSLSLDSWPYAMPLYVAASPDLLIVATNKDTVYEFNADAEMPTTAIWTNPLTPPGEAAVPTFGGSGVQSTTTGILSTPVYDPSSSTIYVVTFTQVVNSNPPTYFYRLHALALADGSEKFGGPQIISSATILGAHNAQRPGLALVNGYIIVCWGSWGDTTPYNGYVTAYSASTLGFAGAFQVAALQGGVWMGGKAPAIDGSNNIYIATGNGPYGGGCNFGTGFDESIVQLVESGNALTRADYFTASSCQSYNNDDYDLGSTGPILMGNGDLLELDKSGNVRVLSTSNLGGYVATNNGQDDSQIVQLLHISSGAFGGSPAYFNNTLYAWATGDVLKAWTWNGSQFTTPAAHMGTIPSVNDNPRSPAVAISANGTSNAIAWVLRETNAGDPAQGVLEAYDASTLGAPIYSSNTNASHDSTGNWVTFRQPLVDNGEVFVESGDVESGAPGIAVYGIVNPDNLSAPTGVTITFQ